MTVRRGNWELYLPSRRELQFHVNGTMLGNSGLKARILSEYLGCESATSRGMQFSITPAS